MGEMEHFDRAIGARSEEQAAFEHYLEELVSKTGSEWIQELEVPKTEREKELLALSAQAASRYVKQYGREKDIAVDLAHIHILKEGGLDKLTPHLSEEGLTLPTLGAVVLDRKKSEVTFALRAFHELYHLKTYKAAQILKQKPRVETYRTGFIITSRDGATSYFQDIEEALTSLMEMRFYEEVLAKEPSVAAEVESLRKAGKAPEFTYSGARKPFRRLIDQLWEVHKAKGKFKRKEDIIDVFLEAQATGHLMRVAHLIEDAYGNGSFRKIGEDTAEHHDRASSGSR